MGAMATDQLIIAPVWPPLRSQHGLVSFCGSYCSYVVWFDRNLLSLTHRVKIFRKSKIYVEGNLLRWTTSWQSKNQKIKDANAFKLFLLVLNWFWISPKNRYCQNPFYAKIYVESLCQETIIFSAFHCYDSLASDTLNHNVAVWRFTRTRELFTFPVTVK